MIFSLNFFLLYLFLIPLSYHYNYFFAKIHFIYEFYHINSKKRGTETMKKLLISLAALMALTGSAFADTASGTSDVTVTVTEGCDASNAVLPSDANFGTFDPLTNAGAKSSSISTGITCTNTTGYDLKIASANGWVMKSGSESIPYSLDMSSAGTVDSTSETNTLKVSQVGTGNVINRTFPLSFTLTNTMKPGNYSDTITTTYTW
jgi:spore coat protein U-like protein